MNLKASVYIFWIILYSLKISSYNIQYFNIEEAEVESEKYLLLNTEAPFCFLFPLCEQKQLLNRRYVLHPDQTMDAEMEAVSNHIDEICSHYGNYDNSLVCEVFWLY